MANEQKDIVTGFRPTDIVRGIFHILSTRLKYFFLVQLKLAIPSTILTVTLQYFLAKYESVNVMIPSLSHLEIPQGQTGYDVHEKFDDHSLNFSASSSDSARLASLLLQFLAIGLIFVLVMRAVVEITKLSVFLADAGLVNHIGQKLSLMDVIRAETNSRSRLFVTFLWASSAISCIFLVQIGWLFLLMSVVKSCFSFPLSFLPALVILLVTFPVVVVAGLSFQLASAVSSGDARAAPRSSTENLLHSRKELPWAAIGFISVLSLIPVFYLQHFDTIHVQQIVKSLVRFVSLLFHVTAVFSWRRRVCFMDGLPKRDLICRSWF